VTVVFATTVGCGRNAFAQELAGSPRQQKSEDALFGLLLHALGLAKPSKASK
jgi:hypothetical protein